MESLSDIEEELRDLSRSAKYCELQPTVNGMTISAYFANLADRIEAIDSADAWRSLYTPGNAAATREALIAIRDTLCEHPYDHDDDALVNIANAALSAPARNCDLYDTQPTMSMAYEAYRKAAMRSYGNGLTGAVPTVKQKPMTYDEWLLAPTAERKGEGDGGTPTCGKGGAE